MQSLDSPKSRGQSLLAAWKRSPSLIGLPMGDNGQWTHCDIRGQECPSFRAVYRNLQHFHAPDCQLTESTLAHCNLSHADFQRCNLFHSNFVSSHLEQARLGASLCRSVNFSHAHLRSASFQRSQLQHALFRFANLHHANLQQSDLRYADLRGANLTGVKVDGASLLHSVINRQTATASQWKQQNIVEWIEMGATWSEEDVTPTRWHTGIDLQSKRTTPFNMVDALPLLCSDLGFAVVAGHPPSIFVAGIEINSGLLAQRIKHIATHSEPTMGHNLKKWAPVHQWLRGGGTITQWDLINDTIACTQQESF